MIDLSTTYLGLKLKNPLVASASPLSKEVEQVKRLEGAGIAAVVMHSLFEEQIIRESREVDYYLARGTESLAEALTYLPDAGTYSLLPDRYVTNVEKLKKSVNIPVIGSLNGVSAGGWTRYAHLIQEAGADALELNLYYISTDPAVSAKELEDVQVDLVAEIKSSIQIPLAVKLSPFYTSFPHFAKRLVTAGADGLVLFNRFYQPEFDIEELNISHALDLSSPSDLRLPLCWIAILYGLLDADFALTSGVHSAKDVLKSMMAGAKVAMMASKLLYGGVDCVSGILEELQSWLEEHEYTSIHQIQGSMSQKSVAEPSAFERANYMKVLSSFRELA
ncbi:MAG TPA: dihydroorotate dehydrogenase-like protein [Anaerolineales bacterium]|nr:dihydroorotate dehydrogenase-like protein [Anaerolineales bacterium]